jgi:dienelactone hydrolase
MQHQQHKTTQHHQDVEVAAVTPSADVAASAKGAEKVPDLHSAQQMQQVTAASAEGAITDKPVANFEAFMEQVAHGMAYDGDLGADKVHFLKVNGYRPGANIHGKRDLVMRTFIPIQAGKPPLVAFRGTVPTQIQTLIADLDPGSIGMYQFKANINEIKAAMAAASAHGPAVVTGHSLGGALAQIAACTFPDMVSSIVTFQAPGIDRSLIAKLTEYNDSHKGHEIHSSHHRVKGDLVPKGGQALTEGVVHNHEMPGRNPLAKHLAYPLAQEEREAGVNLPYQGDKTEMHATGDIPTSQVNADKSQIIEWARKGLGVLVYSGMEVGGAVVTGGKEVIGFMTKSGRFIGRIFGAGEQNQSQGGGDQGATHN